jgi:hypothetical protein
MVDRQNKRLSPIAKLIFTAMGVLGVGGLVLAIYAMRSEPAVPASQVLPAAAAEQAGALPRPAPTKE